VTVAWAEHSATAWPVVTLRPAAYRVQVSHDGQN
jgi:hypothetical protein